MDAQCPEVGKKPKYTTPRWVQVWFLRRSRDRWKARCKEVRAEAKRLQNRVNDLNKSRENWRQRAEELEVEVAALPEQAALKKSGREEPERRSRRPRRIGGGVAG